jgi:hypothetical protein
VCVTDMQTLYDWLVGQGLRKGGRGRGRGRGKGRGRGRGKGRGRGRGRVVGGGAHLEV